MASGFDELEGEQAGPEHALVLGPDASFDQLAQLGPEDDEAGPGWAMAEKTRLGRLALRLSGPGPKPRAAGPVLMEPLFGTHHFDICGPLPDPGVTVLEASAGTGKTFTIAGLVARTVAEGLAPLSQILVVAFTRMATGL